MVSPSRPGDYLVSDEVFCDFGPTSDAYPNWPGL